MELLFFQVFDLLTCYYFLYQTTNNHALRTLMNKEHWRNENPVITLVSQYLGKLRSRLHFRLISFSPHLISFACLLFKNSSWSSLNTTSHVIYCTHRVNFLQLLVSLWTFLNPLPSFWSFKNEWRFKYNFLFSTQTVSRDMFV